uniref:AB hydrolase-1 domain-containing protein n=2 Tax=Pan troglodytes TaxID=9598 RepID=H2QLU1_PANTR
MSENAAPGLISELKLAVPWGHIAAKAWGSLQGPPVLCLHGWLDNANSFDRLIPLLPQDFYYVAMDFGGHGLSSHYSPGVPYYLQTFVSEIRRVASRIRDRVCVFTVCGVARRGSPLLSRKWRIFLTYKRRAIQHVLQVEAYPVSPSHQLLQRWVLLKSNSYLSEECGELLLQRGTTKVATGLVLNRDQRLAWKTETDETCVTIERAVHGYFDSRENYSNKESLSFMIDTMKSTLKERFQFVEVPGNHCVHMSEPQHVASIISSFLQCTHTLPGQL